MQVLFLFSVQIEILRNPFDGNRKVDFHHELHPCVQCQSCYLPSIYISSSFILLEYNTGNVKVNFPCVPAYMYLMLILLLIAFIWLHSEAAAVVDSATQHLLEENNQLLNQIAANIETCKVCIYLGFSCLQPFLLSHRVHGAWKPSNLIMAVSYTVHT